MTTDVHEVTDLRLDPAEVFARLSDPAVIEQRAGADPSMPSQVLGHEADEQGVTIRTLATLPVEWMPAAVRSRLGGGVAPSVERTERWTRIGESLEATTDFTITGVGGVDARANGRSRVTPRAEGGSQLEERVSITVGVPLLGGVVEKALAPRIAATMKREIEVLDA